MKWFPTLHKNDDANSILLSDTGGKEKSSEVEPFLREALEKAKRERRLTDL